VRPKAALHAQEQTFESLYTNEVAVSLWKSDPGRIRGYLWLP